MLIEALLMIVNALGLAMLSMFPVWEPPTQSASWTALSAANIVLPLDVWSSMMGVTIGAMGAGLTVWVVKLAANFIRGSGA